MAASERRFRAVFEGAAIGIAIIGLDGNKLVAVISGYFVRTRCGPCLSFTMFAHRMGYFSDWAMPRAAALSQAWLFAREQLSKTIIAGHACSDAEKQFLPQPLNLRVPRAARRRQTIELGGLAKHLLQRRQPWFLLAAFPVVRGECGRWPQVRRDLN
jgi:hypothetical protein